MTDFLVFPTPDGGEIKVENGQIALDPGLATAFYLSLFGGNQDDDGSDATRSVEFWGNKIEDVPERRLRSKTQALLLGTEASSANRLRLEDAALEDVQWSVELEVVEQIAVAVSIPAPKRAKIALFPTINGEQSTLVFNTPWGIE